jgi:predicted short-subunit dehydrogenase-like oxidoreductase (DUF2520 family)
MKSIADPAHAVDTFAGTWCGAEGDEGALAVLKPAFEAIGAKIFDIDCGSKTIYHAASVIVSNYLTALLEAGVRCYEKGGLSRNVALEVMEPLVRETVNNVFRDGTAGALTGPIARGDHAVVARQMIVVDLAREQGRASPGALAAIERALSKNQ